MHFPPHCFISLGLTTKQISIIGEGKAEPEEDKIDPRIISPFDLKKNTNFILNIKVRIENKLSVLVFVL